MSELRRFFFTAIIFSGFSQILCYSLKRPQSDAIKFPGPRGTVISDNSNIVFPSLQYVDDHYVESTTISLEDDINVNYVDDSGLPGFPSTESSDNVEHNIFSFFGPGMDDVEEGPVKGGGVKAPLVQQDAPPRGDLSSRARDRYLQCPAARGQFPYPPDCSKFLNCWDWRPALQECSAGTLFDSATFTCNHLNIAVCAGKNNA